MWATLISVCLGGTLTAAQQMNPSVAYTVANSLPGFVATFNSDDFFEVFSPPIVSRYGEVVWRMLPSVALPPAIVARFNGSVMAVTGHEVDVVRVSANGTFSSAPCTESYNHHYVGFLYGDGLQMAASALAPGFMPGHGASVKFEASRSTSTTDGTIPGVQSFSEHNGNEARQSFHGLPRGYVQPIVSPQTFVFGPMQINTRNPDGGGRGGPVPTSSQAPPGALYSGLLECPCTTRTSRVGDGYAFFQGPVPCNLPTQAPSAPECFAAVAALLGPMAVAVNVTIANVSAPGGCLVQVTAAGAITAVFNDAPASLAPCEASAGHEPTRAHGASIGGVVGVTVDVNSTAGMVVITLSGPATTWFGVGFNASVMAALPWAIIVDGFGNVTERKLGDHMGGTLLSPTQVIVSANSVVNGVRTVTLVRAVAGMDSSRYSFPAATSLVGTQFKLITAGGGTAAFDGQMHTTAGPASIPFLPVGDNAQTCVCRGDSGSINGVPFDNNRCADEPLSDLKAQNNPTCNFWTYRGGLLCCSDGTIILDANQEVPAPVDEVQYRWRFYFREYDPANQTSLVHLEWQFGNIEYDVPAAPAGTPPQDAVHTITSRFQGSNLLNMYGSPNCNVFSDYYCADVCFVSTTPRCNITGVDPWQVNKATKGVQLIMVGGHCHAPACLSLELFNADTGQLLCRVEPTQGGNDDPLNEAGYLWLPPCQWGAPGLPEPPVIQLDTNLLGVKRANSTFGHTGVMAIFQARGAYVV